MKQQESKKNIVPLFPPMEKFPQMIKQDNINLLKSNIQKKAIMAPIEANHSNVNLDKKAPPLLFQQFAKGEIKIQILKNDRNDMLLQGGDGKTFFEFGPNKGKPTSTEANFILETKQGNSKSGQFKFGQTKQNTINMAKNHLKKPEYSEIEVYGPKEFHEPNVVNNQVQFENIKAKMPSKEQIDRFYEANKHLLKQHGPKILEANKQLKSINQKITAKQSQIAQCRDSAALEKHKLDLDRLKYEKSVQLKLRENSETEILKAMSKYYGTDVNWKSIIGQGMAIGGLCGAAVGLINAIVQILKNYDKGNMSAGEVMLAIGKSVGVGSATGSVLGGVQAFGTQFLKTAQKISHKVLGQISKNAGIILICVMHFFIVMTIVNTTAASLEDRTLQILKETCLLAISIGAVFAIGCFITGPIGWAIGLSTGIGIGVLSSALKSFLPKTATTLLDINVFLESLQGVRSKFFGPPGLGYEIEVFKSPSLNNSGQVFGPPCLKEEQQSSLQVFGAPKLI